MPLPARAVIVGLVVWAIIAAIGAETFVTLVLAWWAICAIGLVTITPIVLLVVWLRQPPASKGLPGR